MWEETGKTYFTSLVYVPRILTYLHSKLTKHIMSDKTGRPGMLASIAEKVASKGMSIENIDTELRTRRTIDGDCREFVVNAFVSSKHHDGQEDAVKLVNELGSLKDELNLDILDIRVQTNKKM